MASSSIDVALEQFKLKRLIKTLDAAAGNGTSAITLVLSSKQDINLTNKMLTEEYGKAKCIKSRVNMLSVLSAITSTQQRLKRYSQTPSNGLVIFCGEVQTADGKERKLTIDFEPFKPMNTSRYLCDSVFHTEYLKDLLEDDDRFGFLIIDGNEALLGVVQGSQRKVLHRYPVQLPKKHGRGGQSAARFGRLRLEARHNYKRKVGEFATQFFIPNGQTPSIKGLIVAGSAELKHDLTSDADLFDPRLQAILMPPLLDICYGGEAGFNQAIQLASGMLKNVKLVQEKNLIASFMEQIARDTGRYCIGISETLEALHAGAIDTLIMWEHFDMIRMVVRNPHTEESNTLILRPDQTNNPKWYRDPKTNVDLDVEEEEPFLDWIIMSHKNFGTKLEFITDRSQEGNQFCKGFGGIGGFMRYKLDFVGEDADDGNIGADIDSKDSQIELDVGGDSHVEAVSISRQEHVEISQPEQSRGSADAWIDKSAVEDWEQYLEKDTEDEEGTEHVQGIKLVAGSWQAEQGNATEIKEDNLKGTDLKDPDPRLHMNVVFMGHVDAGKSTTCGNILLLSGCVDERAVERFTREAKEKHRESWFLAYIMDTNEEERAKGKTVEVGRANFETANRRFTILDAPGHRSYVPNMIAGASQADVGVLLISARKGEFETGFEKGGQTREHALLAKTLGVEKLLCAVNKMDDSSVGWAQERYNEIVNKVRPFLKTNGFKDDQISFLPISGLKGHNIKDRMDTPAWFTGQTLLEAMDAIDMPRSGDESALRMPISDSYKDMGAVVATGKIEQGTIVPGMKCILAPTGIKCSVSCVSIKDEPVKFAKHGENVSLKMAGITEEDLKKGFVLCPLSNPMGAVSKFRAMLHVLELADDRHVLTAGYKSVLHVHAATEECEIIRLEEACPFSDLTQVEQNPKYVRGKSRLTCTISVARPLALDAFARLQQLGRFTLRMEDKTIAIGKVIELLSSPKNAM